jgi:hypothetical protein
VSAPSPGASSRNAVLSCRWNLGIAGFSSLCDMWVRNSGAHTTGPAENLEKSTLSSLCQASGGAPPARASSSRETQPHPVGSTRGRSRRQPRELYNLSKSRNFLTFSSLSEDLGVSSIGNVQKLPKTLERRRLPAAKRALRRTRQPRPAPRVWSPHGQHADTGSTGQKNCSPPAASRCSLAGKLPQF